MAVNVSNTTTTNTFEFWRLRTNQMANLFRERAVTTNSNTTPGSAAISGTFSGGNLKANGTTQSTSTTTGSLQTRGGLGVSRNTHIGGKLVVTGVSNTANVNVTGTVLADYFSGNGANVTFVDAETLDGLNSTDYTSNNFAIATFTTNNYAQSDTFKADIGVVSNNYVQGRYTSNSFAKSIFTTNNYVEGRFTSNSFVKSIFTSNNYVDNQLNTRIGIRATNTYVKATFTSNNYVQGRYTSNSFAKSIFTSNNYINNQLNTRIGIRATNTYVKDTFTSNNYVQGRYTSNSFAKSIFTSNNYINNQLDTRIGIRATNTYVKDTFTSNNYVQNRFTSNSFVKSIFSSNNYVQGRFTSNSFVKSIFTSNNYVDNQLNTRIGIRATNNYVKATFTSNNYVQGRFTSNNFVKSIFTSNNYVDGRFASNNYVQGRYTSNSFVSDTFTSNNYINNQLNTRIGIRATNTYVKSTFTSNNYVQGRFASNNFVKDIFVSNNYAADSFMRSDQDDTVTGKITFTTTANFTSTANLVGGFVKLPNTSNISMTGMASSANKYLRVSGDGTKFVFSNSSIANTGDIGDILVDYGSISNADVLVWDETVQKFRNYPRELIDITSIDDIDDINIQDSPGELLIRVVNTSDSNTFAGTSNGFISGRMNSLSENQYTGLTNSLITYTSTGNSLIQIYMNGVKLSNSDFTVSNNSHISLTNNPVSSDIIQIVQYNPHAFVVSDGTPSDLNQPTYSDINLKENIQPYEASSSVFDIETYTYYWKDKFRFHDRQEVGFVAQDIEKYVPQVVSENSQGEKMVDYSKMTAVLLSTIQQMNKRIELLENKTSSCSCSEE